MKKILIGTALYSNDEIKQRLPNSHAIAVNKENGILISYSVPENIKYPKSCLELQKRFQQLVENNKNGAKYFIIKKEIGKKCFKKEGSLYCRQCPCYKTGEFPNLMVV